MPCCTGVCNSYLLQDAYMLSSFSAFKHHYCVAQSLLCCMQEDFLATLEAMQPDVCLTAAYGKMLPQKFLKIPRCGTVNIHPSLLPKYRGAAPVQRALQVGCMCPVTSHLPVCYCFVMGSNSWTPWWFCPLSSCASKTPALFLSSLPGQPCLAMLTTSLQYLLQLHSFCCHPAISAVAFSAATFPL